MLTPTGRSDRLAARRDIIGSAFMLLILPQCCAFLSSNIAASLSLRNPAIPSLSSFSPAISRVSLGNTARANNARLPQTGTLSMKEEAGGRGLVYKMEDDHEVSYDWYPAAKPTVVYLPALNQTRHGSKSFALQVWAKRNGQGYFSADYFGCGRSGGQYSDGTISKWTEDTVHLIKNVVTGPVILVGAGVGGWIAMHVALKLPDQVKGIVGIAADPDFTTDIVLPELDEETKKKIKDTGMADIVWGLNSYTLSQKLIDDAEDMLLLRGGPKSVAIKCPVRLQQGLGDEEIPPNRALTICDVIESDDIVITYAKFGDHLLDDEEDFRRMTNDVKELCEKFYEYDLSSPSSG